jgi:DNA processing protein
VSEAPTCAGEPTPLGPSEIAAATLACLPDMTPARLRALFEHCGGPIAALELVRSGGTGRAIPPALRRRERGDWSELARLWVARADPALTARRLARRGTHVWVDGAPDYPILDGVPDRPAVLMAEGAAPEALRAPRVAVVGTRAATPHGMADARELGAAMGDAGVTVISGLAIGIDGAAHEGTLAVNGSAVGVVATGLDIMYPRRHATLTERVRDSGAVLSEQGFGVGPRRGLFPVRNRIIAALADVVVVVEATAGGGARITAQFALDYGRTVLAVPGSRRNAAAAGTNALIADGAHPLVDWGDVLVALGMSPAAARTTVPAPPRPAPGPDAGLLLRALGGECASHDELSGRTGLPTPRVAVALVELERSGWIERSRGVIWPR